ncbi:piggyBac transposable element-derived protein 4-like [Achroia grisella]|uniref:piggyBac transposable element-derived protein 4-like n=1 Tax=Achroia grisella TaxID=688607 RepID=UPI0027D2F527|nr:piggyBac transposable element-derived protein 4-like [Achroia grisella]
MQELLKTPSSNRTKSEKQEIKNKKYEFIHSFEDKNTDDDSILDFHTKDINIKIHSLEQKLRGESHLQEHLEQEQEEERQEQEEERQEQEKDRQKQEEKHQDQDEVHLAQGEEQVRQSYDEQQEENYTECENKIQARRNVNEEYEDTDISIESLESTDVEVNENEASESELESDNQIAETESTDNDDSWIDISDDVCINFEESAFDSAIIPRLCNKTPIDIYRLFLTDEIIDKIVRDTNNYATKYFEDNQDNVKAKSRLKAWKPTDDEEIRKFFGVILVMGLNTVPHINDYWSKKSIYRNEYICSTISRDRFLIIFRFWHFCDESIDNTGDKLYKIRQIHDMLNFRFQQVLRPGKILVIDESMIPWRGRLKFRQYIKNKSHKYGVKLYKLCTPEGYSYNTIIYTGKEGNRREQDHGKMTVLRLIKGLENEGRIVIADNFYSSIGLAEELLKQKTFYCGTLRSNRRGLPKKVISTKLKKGHTMGKMNLKGVKIIKWCDKRQVLMITTCKGHNAVLINTGKKTRATNEHIKKPSCVLMYNENKKGIDYSDQMSSYYTTLKRGLKWYRKVMAEFLFGTSLVNAWIIYNMSNAENKMPKKDFTESIIEALTGRSISEREL